MDAVLKLCLDTTDVERAFDEIDNRLKAYSDESSSPFSGGSPDEKESSMKGSIDESALLNRILEELETLSGTAEGIAETLANQTEILNGIRQALENAAFIQGVTAV